MKTNLVKLSAISLLLFISSFAIAQEKTTARYMVGDTIMLKDGAQTYLTGERPSAWVYKRPHTIQQVGTRRFPDGLLLKGILSWISPADVVLAGAVEHSGQPQVEDATIRQQPATLPAQKAPAKNSELPVYMVGDTIMLKDGAQTYLTGERPSAWVYGQPHTVQQVGTRRFPDGLLLEGIVSWISPADVVLTGAVERPEKPAPVSEDSVSRQQENIVVEPVGQDSVAKQETLPADTTSKEQTVIQEENPQFYFMEQKPAEFSNLMPFHRFSISMRGGVASLMQKSDVMGSWRPGFDALLDLQYAYYFGAKQGKKVNMGILTGVSLGWAQSALKAAVDTAYSVTTDDGVIDYSISAKQAKENNGQLQLEIPVMFTLLTEKGLYFNVGPRFMLPAFSHYKQTLTDPTVNAYFPEEGVNVSNEVITGRVEDNQLTTKGKWNASKINIMLSAELGYEWMFRSGNSLGLGVYANYSVWSMYQKTVGAYQSLIGVTPPSGDAPAVLDVFSATDTYVNGLGYFDCGLKISYNFNFFKQQKL